jgi:hypothetical protein
VAWGVPLVVEILDNTGTGATSPLIPAVPIFEAKTTLGNAIAATNARTKHNAKNFFTHSPLDIIIFLPVANNYLSPLADCGRAD